MKHLKTLYSILIIIITFSSCNPSNKSKEEKEDTQISATKEMHTALKSLDWQGKYRGIVPCADCEGIETTLTLKEQKTYFLSLKYLGKRDSIYTSEGSFIWHEDGMRISLQNEKYSATDYFVAENQVFQLDKRGAKIKGDLGEYYVLLKQ